MDGVLSPFAGAVGELASGFGEGTTGDLVYEIFPGVGLASASLAAE